MWANFHTISLESFSSPMICSAGKVSVFTLSRFIEERRKLGCRPSQHLSNYCFRYLLQLILQWQQRWPNGLFCRRFKNNNTLSSSMMVREFCCFWLICTLAFPLFFCRVITGPPYASTKICRLILRRFPLPIYLDALSDIDSIQLLSQC